MTQAFPWSLSLTSILRNHLFHKNLLDKRLLFEAKVPFFGSGETKPAMASSPAHRHKSIDNAFGAPDGPSHHVFRQSHTETRCEVAFGDIPIWRKKWSSIYTARCTTYLIACLQGSHRPSGRFIARPVRRLRSSFLSRYPQCLLHSTALPSERQTVAGCQLRFIAWSTPHPCPQRQRQC